jgi:ethanolamine utilization protein EutP
MFTKPVIGMVTKIDLAVSREQIEKARQTLTLAGAGKVFEISNTLKKGIEEVKKLIYG